MPYLWVALARGLSRVMRDSSTKELSNEHNIHSFFTMTLLLVRQKQGNKDVEEIGDVYTHYNTVLHCIDCNASCGDAPWAPYGINQYELVTFSTYLKQSALTTSELKHSSNLGSNSSE